MGSTQPSLLRLSIPLAGAAALGACLLGIAEPAAAGSLAPDPAPAVDVRPDPAPSAPVVVSRPPAVPAVPAPARTVTVAVAVAVAVPPVHRRRATPHRRKVVHARPRAAQKPQRPLPFPTLAIKWFSDAAVPAAERSGEVPVRVALVLAALVLASAALVAGAAREAAR